MSLVVAVAGVLFDPPLARAALLQRVREAAAAHDVAMQVMDPAAVYGDVHLRHAAAHAARATQRQRSLARDPGAQIACYAAGEPQIARALARVGVQDPASAAVVVAVGEKAEAAVAALYGGAGARRDDSLVAPKPEALVRLGISPKQAADPLDLVLERVALVDVFK